MIDNFDSFLFLMKENHELQDTKPSLLFTGKGNKAKYMKIYENEITKYFWKVWNWIV